MVTSVATEKLDYLMVTILTKEFLMATFVSELELSVVISNSYFSCSLGDIKTIVLYLSDLPARLYKITQASPLRSTRR